MWYDSAGITKERRYYIIVNKGFKLLIDTNDFRKEYKRVFSSREVVVYVDTVSGAEDGGVDEGGAGAVQSRRIAENVHQDPETIHRDPETEDPGSNTNPTILPPLNEVLNEEDALEDAVITQDWQCLTQDTPVYRLGPSMYQQLGLSNQHLGVQARVQIGAPLPMFASQGVPRFILPRMSSQLEHPIINEGGYKYLDLNKRARN
ncbi:hypothetical protein Salat_2251200 [Sesamum alatum]|uniref:Uncharacterized protein n=1 Tax=Sesamum alatum TaxID=300844 RepID=A0AAE2CDS0_9LAMI|nr:hypothetical protein Salat_2251200 [Sesamum alatum]